jgi:hypothetical protein
MPSTSYKKAESPKRQSNRRHPIKQASDRTYNAPGNTLKRQPPTMNLRTQAKQQLAHAGRPHKRKAINKVLRTGRGSRSSVVQPRGADRRRDPGLRVASDRRFLSCTPLSRCV